MKRNAPLVAVAFLAVSASAQDVQTIYVSPIGNDSNPGTQASPKRTPAGGLAGVRAARSGGSTKQFIIQFAPGRYQFDDTLKFISSDSGTDAFPLVVRGQKGTVFFDGSRQVTGWQKASGGLTGRISAPVRDKVFMAPLPTVNGQPMNTGSLNRRGWPYTTTQTWSALVFNNQPMTLAKHPNQGWLYVPSNHDGHSRRFGLSDPFPYSWQYTNDIWVYGYLAWDWADSFERVSGIDAASQRVYLATEPYYGIKKDMRYMLVNAIEAVDSPGEYFIDKSGAKVYFYVPLEGASDSAKIAALNAGVSLTSLDKTLVETYDARNIVFESITFQNGRRDAVWVRYGKSVSFQGCTFRRFGYDAATISAGTNHSFVSCDFYDLDEKALVIYGGDRASLTPSGHVVQNCWFRDYSKVCRTYRPAVDLWGVGHVVRYSRFEEAPHTGIVIKGNDHLIEFNDFKRIGLETNDSGAVYINRNPTYQGNRVINNRFVDLWTRQQGNYSNFVTGVYMDDMACGTEVSRNIFKDVQIPVAVGGGRDNVIDNNYFFGSQKSVHFDSRGTAWASNFLLEWGIAAYFGEVPYQGSLWSTRYPKLLNYFYDQPQLPKRNVLTRNVHVGQTADWLLLLDGLTVSTSQYKSHAIYGAYNYVGLSDPGFADAANDNYTFTKSSALSQLGVKPINASKIGLYYDGHRSWIP